jgi:hypothetical protein
MADEGLAASLAATAANGLPWDPKVDWSKLNQPFGQVGPAAPVPPSERITSGVQDLLGAAGADPYTSGILANKLMGLVQATPLGVPLAAADTVHYKNQDNIGGTAMAAVGMIPGVKPGVKAAAGIGSQLASAIPITPGDVRVSTRFPTGVTAAENPLTHQLSIGTAEMKASPGFEHNVSLLSEYPGFGRLKGMNDEQAVQAYLDQARGNMQYLYNRSPDEMKARSPSWYEGAHEISDALAQRWGVPRPSVSGSLASLSPQMDWYKNASLGERVGDIMTGAAAGRVLTPEMAAFQKTSVALNNPANAERYQRIAGKSLDQLDDPGDKALWIRLYDEAHNPRAYRSITPEGDYGGYILNADGTPAKIGWGAIGEIEKAVKSMESGGDPRIISPILGTKHKVRNFYNNIEVPNDPRFGDVTADTHQVAAAQMRPLSGSTPAVAHNLASGLGTKFQPEGYRGPKSSDVTGVQGTYGLTADATRMMAMENEMLPRAAQSATWEPVRELFSPAFKADKKNTAAVDDIWRAYDRGNITLDQARDKIFDLAGGIGTPSWAGLGAGVTAPTRGSTYR